MGKKVLWAILLFALILAAFWTLNRFTHNEPEFWEPQKPVPESQQSQPPAKTTEIPPVEPPVVKKAEQPHQYCNRETFEEKSYIVCRVHPQKDDIRLFLNDADGAPYKRFRNVEKILGKNNETFAFAMNAGMYHADYTAVGLYIENGKQQFPISIKDGTGNFHMKPNGVFFIADGKAGVLDTQNYLKAGIKPELASQSGPMLVIDGKLHQRFIPNSPFLEYRNGVGVTKEGKVIFIISEVKVNFDEMGRFYRDILQTPNALYFDGSISSIYSPELKRYDWWHGLGPIIGVVVKKREDRDS